MSSPVEVGDRMSWNHDDDDDSKSATALDDRLKDNDVRQQLIREANDAKARCLMRVRISPATRRSLSNRLIHPSSTCQLSIVLFTLLVIVYSSTRSIIATDQVPFSSPPPSTRIKLLDTDRTTATEATYQHHHHHHHVGHKKPPTPPVNGSISGRGENLNSDPEREARMSAPSSVRLPRTNIKINRTRRASDGIMANSRQRSSSASSSSAVNVCDDCLAIPMVALVGNKQVNGFLLHPAPANLQRHQSMASSSSSATSLSSSHYAPTEGSHRDPMQQSGNGINRARYAHNNNHDHNITHYGPEGASAQASLIGGQSASSLSSSSSYGVPLSTHGAYYRDQPPGAYPRRPSGSGEPMGNGHYQHHQYRQAAAYKQVVSSSPFEPKSDEKCPMTGPLTVCDQINSYPADAIVHRVAAAKRALHKAYFDIDSLFSDEADGFTEPFGATPASANASDSGSGDGAMMPAHHHHHHHHHHHRPSPEPNHDNMTVAFNANPSARHEHRHHYTSGPTGYYQSTPASTASTQAYRAYDQQTMSDSGAAHEQEQIEVNNQRMEFAKRARASPSLSRGSRGGAASSGQSLELHSAAAVAARPSSSSAALGSAVVQRRQQAKRSPSSSTASSPAQRANIGAPNDFLEHQTQGGGDFLYLVERRGLSIGSGGRQMNTKAAREDSGPSDDGQTMDHYQQQRYEDGLLSLIAADSAPTRSSVKSENEAHKSRQARASATLTDLKPNARASGSDTASGDVLRSPGTIISASATLRQIPSTISNNTGPEARIQQQQARAAISRAITGQATDTSGQGLRNETELSELATGSNDTREVGALSTHVQPKLADKIPTTADDGKRPAAASAVGLATGLQLARPLSPSARLQAGQQLRSARASDHKSRQLVQPSYSPLSSPAKQQQQRSRIDLTAKSSFSSDSAIKLSHKDEQRNGRQSPAGPKPIDRSKRQVAPLPPPIQVDRTPAARGPPRTTITTTTTTTAAPTEDLVDPERAGSTSTEEGGEQAPAPQPICRAKSIYISPKAAMNHKKQWKYVVNAPERDPRIKQIIRVDICEAPFEPCSGDVTLPLGFTSQCKQKYAKKKLLALDARSGLLEVDTFFIPSCCVCQLIPPASTRFGLESPLSTTSSEDESRTPTTIMANNNGDDDGDNDNDNDASPGTPESTNGDDSRVGGRGGNTEVGNNSGVIDDNGDNNAAGDNPNEGR